jgi:hypothetical protein
MTVNPSPPNTLDPDAQLAPFTVTPTLQIGPPGPLPARPLTDPAAAMQAIESGDRVRVSSPQLAEQILLALGVDPIDARWRTAGAARSPQRLPPTDAEAAMRRIETHNGLDALAGVGPAALFDAESGPLRPVPFPRASRSRHRFSVDRRPVEAGIASGVTVLVDPRRLSATQPSITRDGIRFYSTDRYQRTGDTHQGDRDPGNRLPLVYVRDGTEALILAGHHRATVALVQGQTLEAIVVAGTWGATR